MLTKINLLKNTEKLRRVSQETRNHYKRLVIINLIMAVSSLVLLAFGGWTYQQSTYQERIKKSFYEKSLTEYDQLKVTLSLTDRMVLLKGKVIASQTFNSRRNKPVVIERYREETKSSNPNRGWETVKGSVYFRAIPFRLEFSNGKSILIDTFDVEPLYIGEPDIQEEHNTPPSRKSFWQISPQQTVYIMGKVEDKAGEIVITNPNLSKDSWKGWWEKEPLIITSFSTTEVSEKAGATSRNLYLASMALSVIGVLFLLVGFGNALSYYRKAQEGAN